MGEALGVFAAVRQELVQRRVEQPDRHRQPGHGLEDAVEVLPLHGQQLGQRAAAPTPRAMRASCGVSALARTRKVRISSAQPNRRANDWYVAESAPRIVPDRTRTTSLGIVGKS